MAKRKGFKKFRAARAAVPASEPADHNLILLGLFFASGFAALVYEVLWMKELGLLFGNTSQAAATTLAAFFLGLAAGGYVFGRKVARSRRPLRDYALLEGGIAVSALLYFLLQHAYHALYGPLFGIFGPGHALFTAVKFGLALIVLFPPAFFMGGTLPALSQHLVRRPTALGHTTATLYTVNTLGGALGAYVAGFHLPALFGFTHSYLFAITLTGAIAITAWWLGVQTVPPEDTPAPEPGGGGVREALAIPPHLSNRAVLLLAGLSGFVTLALEVLWTRMFAQVLQNSVYTFSIILVTFLISLTLGAAGARHLSRRNIDPPAVLFTLLTSSALLVGLSPFVLSWATDGLAYLGGHSAWGAYVARGFATAALVILPPGILLGTIFPYLMKISEPLSHSAGRTVGRLAAMNTLGAISGSLCAGFLLLDLSGLWGSIRWLAAAYFLTALIIAPRLGALKAVYRLAPAGGLVLLVSLLDPTHLPLVTLNAAAHRERVLDVWEGSAATVSVVKTGDMIGIRMNNHYAVGGTGTQAWDEAEAHLPLQIHPRPRSVFFLGMGTGVSAGAALKHSVKRVVVTELVPEVIKASRKYFTPYTNGLFSDPRATVVVEDGRNYLLGTREHYDVIIGDLFLPWKAGSGSLYTQEHFSAVRSRLNPGGIFAQWLPLYQISRDDFGIIARTMLDVFPMVTLWRADFFPDESIVALVGHRDTRPLGRDAPALQPVPARVAAAPGDAQRVRQTASTFLLYYCGNLSHARTMFNGYPLNTDDRPMIEYLAPVNQRQEIARRTSWFTGARFLVFLNELIRASPPERDPYLADVGTARSRLVYAGLDLYKSHVLEMTGDRHGAARALKAFNRLVTTRNGRGTGTGQGGGDQDP